MENRDRVFAVKSLRVYESDPVETINKVWNFFTGDWLEGLFVILYLEILQ